MDIVVIPFTKMKLAYSLILALLIINIQPSICADNTEFYKLLNIEKDADNKEIRKAFKKLALKMHPDKNPVSNKVERMRITVGDKGLYYSAIL